MVVRAFRVGSLADISKAELLEIAHACYLDPVLYCKTFLPHLFPGEIPWVHRGLLAILSERTGFLNKYGDVDKIIKNFVYVDTEGNTKSIFRQDDDGGITLFWRQFLEIMMPRGFSKTTYAGIAMPLYMTTYQLIKFGAYLSEAADHAIMQMENVRRELSENERIIQVFGDLKPRLKDDEKWSAKMFEALNGTAFVARGRGAQVRGLNHRGVRPQLILVDDVEDKESVETEAQREKTRRWFFADVIPALPTIGKGRLIVIGTMLHPDALLPTLASDDRFTVVKFGIKDADGDYLWSEAIDEAKDEVNKKSYANAGQLSSYYMEYHNEPRSEETALFKREWIRYSEPSKEERIVGAATYCDPALSERKTADEAVVITVLQTDKGKVYVTDGWGERGHVSGSSEKLTENIIDEFFRQHKIRAGTNHASFAGCEANAYQGALIITMRQEMFKRGYYFNLEPVTHSNKKNERIVGILQPRFQNGFIYFTRKFPKLEAQLLDYRPKQDQADDWPDALAGAVKLLDPVSPFYMENTEFKEDEDDPYQENSIPDVNEEIYGKRSRRV